MAELFAGILEPLVGNLVKVWTWTSSSPVGISYTSSCTSMWSFLFSLILFVVVIVTCLGLFFSSNESCSMGFFPGLSIWLWHIFCSKILRNDPRRVKESVASSSKHITLQEVQFFTTWIPMSTLLGTTILWDSDRLTERPWVLTTYINHSGGNLVHIHKHF